LLLVAGFANAQNYSLAAEQSFARSAAHAAGGQMQNTHKRLAEPTRAT
jgi:hypothetical protein